MSGTTFDSKSKSVGELLGTNTRERIVVPTFQRGYEWGKSTSEPFGTTFFNFKEKVTWRVALKSILLGPIVTLQKSKDVIELLDGQQRLATATILLSVLRDVAKETGIKDRLEFARDTQTQLILKEGGEYALQMGETDEIYFRETIQSDVAQIGWPIWC